MSEVQRPERSLGELLGELSSDLSLLFRQEVALAKEEVKAEGQKAQRAGIAFGAAAVVGLLAGVALVMTLGFALDSFLPSWLGFLIVTVVLGIVTAVLVKRGQAVVKEIEPVPEKTIETLKEDAQWLSEQRS
jgi:F0F1-type ATP synthase assembly protein I